jgi:hypothetical protein
VPDTARDRLRWRTAARRVAFVLLVNLGIYFVLLLGGTLHQEPSIGSTDRRSSPVIGAGSARARLRSRRPHECTDGPCQLCAVDRLGAVLRVSRRERVVSIVRASKRRDGYGRHIVSQHPQPPHQLMSIDTRHGDIGDQDVDRMPPHQIQRALGAVALPHACTSVLEERGQHLPGITLIIHHENGDVVEPNIRRPDVCRGVRRPIQRTEGIRQLRWQANGGGRPCAGAVAVRPNLTAVLLDQVPRDCEPQPEPAVGPRRTAVGLPEPIEHVREKLQRNPHTGIANLDLQPCPGHAAVERHGPAVRSELQRVGKHVVQNLMQALGITFNRRKLRVDVTLERDPLRLRRGRDSRNDRLEELRYGHRDALDLQLAG